jgi:hypothetical protein
MPSSTSSSLEGARNTQPAGAVAASPHALGLISDADLQQLDADLGSLMDGWGDVSNDNWQQMLGDLNVAASMAGDAPSSLLQQEQHDTGAARRLHDACKQQLPCCRSYQPAAQPDRCHPARCST